MKDAPGSARIGCSGFSYSDWRGIVYPADMPQSCWLHHCATMFDTVELNKTLVPRAMRWAVELRDASWLHDDVFEVLRRHDAALCIHDLLADHPYILTSNWMYVRFHGPNAISNPYRGAYGAARLHPWADRLRCELDAGHDVYCYFNNDYDGHAVTDATWLHAALARPVD